MTLYPPGFVEPCLPTVCRAVPTGPQWAYEIKHDDFRFIWADACQYGCERLTILRAKSGRS
jgi:hypothetical protein